MRFLRWLQRLFHRRPTEDLPRPTVLHFHSRSHQKKLYRPVLRALDRTFAYTGNRALLRERHRLVARRRRGWPLEEE